MAEEFSESDVFFSDNHQPELLVEPPPPPPPPPQQQQQQQQNSLSQEGNNGHEAEEKKRKMVRSVPVSIPEAMFRRWGYGEEDEDEEMVPPHVIIARRIAGKMAFSVCTGNGRTLKGRDLCRVRNSVLRLTGFIEV